MASPKRSATKCHVRSVSLPSRSHPASLKIVQELDKLRLLGSASGSARPGLFGLEELYAAVNEFLALTSTRDVISCNKNEGCVEELLDGLVRLLDAFGLTSDLVSQIKERSQEVQSAIRRRNPDPSSVEEAVSEFSRLRKRSRKEIKKAIGGAKRIEAEFRETRAAMDHDRDFFSAMTVLREVVASSASILQGLLSSLDNNKGSKWGVILSNLVHKRETGAANPNASDGNEFEGLEEVLACLSEDVSMEKMKMTQDQLRDLETGIAHIEDDLDGLCRRLIRTRASLLNIISL